MMTPEEWAESRERVRAEKLLRENPEMLASEIAKLMGFEAGEHVLVIDADGNPQLRKVDL